MGIASGVCVVVLVGLALGAGPGPAVGQVPRTWSSDSVRALIGVIRASGAEGLSPADYDPDGLEGALDGAAPDLDRRADDAALSLAHDYFEGRVRASERADRHIARGLIDYQAWLSDVVARGSIRASFARLLPVSPAYRDLRASLAHCGAQNARCETIVATLDRWRWLPRDFGSSYLWVNVPAFRLDLIENGAIVASHKVIVGKPGTRTPVFKATVTGVTINPWWNVPCSIVDESIGKLVRTNPREAARRGYVASVDKAGRLQVRQKPGPNNALGRIKLEMPNPYGVYIHDTPSRDLFDKDKRAFSHGCIRTEAPDALARTLLGKGQAGQVDLLLLTGGTRTLRLPQALPVYVVYLTAEPDPSVRGGLLTYPDIYQRDGAALANARTATAAGDAGP